MTAHSTHRWAVEYREADGHWYLRHRDDSNEALTFATRTAARAWRVAHPELRDARVVPVVVETRVAA